MSPDELTISQWTLLDRRLIWAYSGAPAACFRRTLSCDSGHASAKCFLRGHGDYTIDGVTRRCRQGDWLFLPPSVPFSQRLSDDASHISIRFRLHWPSGLPLFVHDRLLTAQATDLQKFTALSTRLCFDVKPGISNSDPSGAHGQRTLDLSRYLANETLFHRWLAVYCGVMRGLGVPPRPMEKVTLRLLPSIRFAEAQMRTGHISVADLARYSGFTENHLGRLFREAFGISPSEFINQRRLQSVIHAVEFEHQSLKEVAFAFGFGSPQHFSRWFKRMTGKPPRNYFNSEA